ncbi:MAG: hypothetical protein V4726_01260 [Verrucomicrobiota bacterium]
MNSRLSNYITSFRTRFACLDLPENRPIWENRPPLAFTKKAALARTALDALAKAAGAQSAATTGSAADKQREEQALEDAAHTLAQALAIWAQDQGDLTLAHKYDQPLSHWRHLRDEELLQRARLLETDATKVLTHPEAADFGLTSDAVTLLHTEIEDYAACIAAPQEIIAGRSVLTKNLNPRTRAIVRLFDQMEALLLQFNKVPEGPPFVQAFLASSQIIRRGHRFNPPALEETPPPPAPAPAAPTSTPISTPTPPSAPATPPQS